MSGHETLSWIFFTYFGHYQLRQKLGLPIYISSVILLELEYIHASIQLYVLTSIYLSRISDSYEPDSTLLRKC